MDHALHGIKVDEIDRALHDASEADAVEAHPHVDQDVGRARPEYRVGGISVERDGDAEAVRGAMIVGEHLRLDGARNGCAVGEHREAREADATGQQCRLRRSGCDRDQQRDDTGEHRVKKFVELRDANPLGRVAELLGGDLNRLPPATVMLRIDQVPALNRLTAARPT